MAGFIIVLGCIGFAVIFVWFFKETWNDPGMSDEKFERLFKKKRYKD